MIHRCGALVVCRQWQAFGVIMFEGIQRGLGEALKKLRGRGRITEANIRESMGEIRRALLDADVNFTVANDFISRVTEREMKSLATVKLTSASSRARRISPMLSRMLASVIRPRPRSFFSASPRPRWMPSNMMTPKACH